LRIDGGLGRVIWLLVIELDRPVRKWRRQLWRQNRLWGQYELRRYKRDGWRDDRYDSRLGWQQRTRRLHFLGRKIRFGRCYSRGRRIGGRSVRSRGQRVGWRRHNQLGWFGGREQRSGGNDRLGCFNGWGRRNSGNNGNDDRRRRLYQRGLSSW